jgi:hypothetical protein
MYNASQFGQLNRFTGDFGICRPIFEAAGTSLVRVWPQATLIELMVVHRIIRTHELAFVFSGGS